MTAGSTSHARNIYIAGRGLTCSLGNTLVESLTHLSTGGAAQSSIALGTEAHFPFHAIQPPAPADTAAWTARARRLIGNAVQEAEGSSIRHAPLFIASSSLNMGAIELGQARLRDMHAEAEEIASWLDWQGPVYWISTACTSSLNALLSASCMMREGLCDDALVLGIELANRYTLSGFAAMQLLSPTRAQPLGAERDGLVLGEAVAALRLTTTPQRWALLGGASVVSNRDATGASREAVEACWKEALQASGLDTDNRTIDLIKLQAAGSPTNDVIELDTVDAVFARTPALTSLKAYIGHTLGASGAAEIALLTAALEARIWPAVHHAQDTGLAHGLSTEAPALCARLLTSIIGFGGSHACAVLQDSSIEPGMPVARSTSAPGLWEVCGRSGPVLPDDWRENLTALLGQRPRRIGAWAETGLYGALQCMHDAGETSLPAGAILRISSLHGPMAAILQTLQTIAEDGNAMPFAFLQSQPGQLPAIIAQALQWQGNARITNHRNPLALLHTACCEAGADGVLIGWLEEDAEPGHDALPATSYWLRLRPATTPAPTAFRAATAADLRTCRYVRIEDSGVKIAL